MGLQKELWRYATTLAISVAILNLVFQSKGSWVLPEELNTWSWRVRFSTYSYTAMVVRASSYELSNIIVAIHLLCSYNILEIYCRPIYVVRPLNWNELTIDRTCIPHILMAIEHIITNKVIVIGCLLGLFLGEVLGWTTPAIPSAN